MTTTACIHHWLLADGLVNVPGRCKHCGAERIFSPALGDDWGASFGPAGSYTTSNYSGFNRERTNASRARGGMLAKQRARKAAQ